MKYISKEIRMALDIGRWKRKKPEEEDIEELSKTLNRKTHEQSTSTGMEWAMHKAKLATYKWS